MIRHPKKRAFLAAFAKVGLIGRAAKMARVNRTNHRLWMKSPEYASAFSDAKEMACEILEAEMRRRAVKGVSEPVFQGGVQVGVVQKYSDVLLIFALKGAMPEKYRERYEHTGANGAPLPAPTVNVTVNMGDLLQQLGELKSDELGVLELLASRGAGPQPVATPASDPDGQGPAQPA